jgi:hypothetical protein
MMLHALLTLCTQVIQSFVRQAMGYVDSLPDKETQSSLIKTLQTVTEGKVCCHMAAAHGPPCHGVACLCCQHMPFTVLCQQPLLLPCARLVLRRFSSRLSVHA